MDFKNSKTFANIQNSFEQELMTSSRNSIYALKAREQEYIEISDIFEITSQHDLEHASIWFKILNNGEIPDTEANLTSAYENNKIIGTSLYREYASIAREEGFHDIATLFDGMANIESSHDTMFFTLAERMQNDTVFCGENEKLWICMKCGNIISGTCAPNTCPICGYPQGFYREFCEAN
jgi:rubrerythrin